MFKIKTMNKIASVGLNTLPREEFEIASELTDPDAIIVRSKNLHELEFNKNLKAIARAGAGTNNIPIEKCTEKGIVVFNTPGANANGVKELVLTGLFLASRDIIKGINWTQTLTGNEIPKEVEENKKRFAGKEIKGKTLGVIGLGAIGVNVANAANSLGMNVIGYDPFISVEAAWGLSRDIERATSLDILLSKSDYITIHVPLIAETKGLINKEKFKIMKKDVSIMNFARGGIVNNEDLIQAINEDKINKYITDFPDKELIGIDKIYCIPHLGASTIESEENCAIMATKQLKDFLETGSIKNSVNFPDCSIEGTSNQRIVIINKNIPDMVRQITKIISEEKLNISEMINKHKNNIAYNIIDIGSGQKINDDFIEKLKKIEGVISARKIQ